MKRKQTWLGSIAILTCATVAHAQCPVDRIGQGGDGALFGSRLAAAGDELLVGTANGNHAFLFENVAGNWTRSFRFDNPAPAPDSRFGRFVALAGDTAVIGDPNPQAAGLVQVFQRVGTGWVHQATLQPTGGFSGDSFGAYIATDGDTIVATKAVAFAWDVHVFELGAGGWQETAVLNRPGVNFFGSSLAIQGDTLLVGDSGNGDLAFNAGAAYFYRQQAGGAWALEARVDPAESFDSAMFGSAVALDGDRAVVAAPAFFNDAEGGAAEVFERSGTDWVRVQRLVPEVIDTDTVTGLAVSIAGDRVVVAGWGDQLEDTPGSAFVFEWGGSTWSQTGKLLSPEAGRDYDLFGSAVAQRGDEVLVGAPTDGPAGRDRGRVHVFDVTLDAPVNYCQSTPNSTGAAARIASIGSNLVAADDVILRASDVPDEPGFFIIGAQTAQRPLSDGFLCVGPPLARLPMTAGSGGVLLTEVELAGLPLAPLPGSSWNFQAWFMDPAAGGSGANLSDGVTVTFCQ